MKFFKEYNSLPNYLMRFTLVQVGRLHIRLHNIISKDTTPFLHNHPFSYISIILKGSYDEQLLVDNKIVVKTHKPGSIIFRTNKDYHRINNTNGCKTLFIAIKSNNTWSIKRHDSIDNPIEYKTPTDGIHTRQIKGRKLYCKVVDGIWYIGNEDYKIATNETRQSIHQNLI